MIALRGVSGGGHELAGAADQLSRPAPLWLGLALTAEIMSYLLYATAQRCLLDSSPSRPGVRWLASLAVSAQALSNFVPAGYIAANLLNFRELSRRGIGRATSARLLIVSSSLYIGALACLTLGAAELTGAGAGRGLAWVRIAAACVLGLLLVLFVTLRSLTRRGILRMPRAWRDCPAAPGLTPGTTATAACLFTASWMADAACLIAAAQAVGAHLPWSLVPIAYCAAQLASFVPLTPGGLGLVEGSLALTLATASGTSVPLLAAVLLYRIVSYWGTLPAAGLGYLAVRRGRLAASTSLAIDDESRQVALRDRPAGPDRPRLVLEG